MQLEDVRQILIEYSRSKKNGVLPLRYTHEKAMTNPLCGDHVEIKMLLNKNKITEIGFKTQACAICSASTAVMCDLIEHKDLQQALQISDHFENAVLAKSDVIWPEDLFSLKIFEHLKINQARRVCALLPWVTLRSALKGL